MLDSDVRAALHRQLTADHALDADSTRIVDEFEVLGLARCDVAVINGALAGYELKSASDSLRRLPGQIEQYSRVFDFATLVVADCHLREARKLLPRWWGYSVARWSGESVTITPKRMARPNPSIDCASVALLLWREEALGELAERGLDRGRRGWPRARLCESLAMELAPDELRAAVRSRLRGRAARPVAP